MQVLSALQAAIKAARYLFIIAFSSGPSRRRWDLIGWKSRQGCKKKGVRWRHCVKKRLNEQVHAGVRKAAEGVKMRMKVILPERWWRGCRCFRWSLLLLISSIHLLCLSLYISPPFLSSLPQPPRLLSSPPAASRHFRRCLYKRKALSLPHGLCRVSCLLSSAENSAKPLAATRKTRIWWIWICSDILIIKKEAIMAEADLFYIINGWMVTGG